MAETANSCAACGKAARGTCKACSLVTYCGADCQKAHWDQHKVHCKSALGKSSWQPQWLLENRVPAFVGDGPPVATFGANKYLWGNVPAHDVLQLPANEGSTYKNDLHLLFAASGDIRNVVKTIASLPTGFTQPIDLYINARNLDVVSRNLILLLIGLSVKDDSEAVQCMIHVWYSAFLRASDVAILRGRIRPNIEDICGKIQDKPSGLVLGKTWKLAQHSCRIELTKESWGKVLLYLDNVQSLSSHRADQIRSAVTLAPERVDYRERFMLASLTPAHRICMQRFREDDILLPFGASRLGFNVPDPTMFQGVTWPMKDDADPLEGWNFPEILEQKSVPASNDIYGKLYYYLHDQLSSFRRKVRTSTSFNFKLFNMDAKALAGHFGSTVAFDRIETSNIADGGYLGTGQVLAYLGTSLKPRHVNPHATLITLYMNAVNETAMQHSGNSHEETLADMKRVAPYIFGKKDGKAFSPFHFSQYNKSTTLMASSQNLGRDVDKHFDRYMRDMKFSEMPQHIGLMAKDVHTIIEKWPLRRKLSLPQKGAQEEFDILQASGHMGSERYVEWRRV